MRLLDPSKPHPVTAGAATYWLRVPRLVDRAAYRRAIVADGGRQHSHLDLIHAMKRGIEGLAAASGEPAPADALAAIDAAIAQLMDFALRLRGGEIQEEDVPDAIRTAMAEVDRHAEALKGVEALVRAHWPPYREMLADNEAYPEIAALAAARMFLLGWEGVPGLANRKAKPFGHRGPPDEALAAIPPGDLGRVRDEVEALLAPTGADAKNSGSPRPGPAAAKSSKATSTSRQRTRSSTTVGSSPSSGSA